MMIQDDNEAKQETAEPTRFLSSEAEERIEKSIRAHRRRELIRNFLERSRIGWLLHPAPMDSYFRDYLLPTVIAAKRARFLKSVSWPSLLLKRSERMYQLGLGGIVIAPLVSLIFIHAGADAAAAFPLQMSVLYLSGLAYVLASALLQWRCPDLIKEVEQGHRDGESSERQVRLQVLVEEAIQRHVMTRVFPIEAALRLRELSSAADLAAHMYRDGLTPFLTGFGSLGRYRLEEAICICADAAGVGVFEDSGIGATRTLSAVDGPKKVIEGGQPYVVDLYVRGPYDDELKPSSSEENVRRRPKANDLIIRWCDRGVDFGIRPTSDVSIPVTYLQGVDLLYRAFGSERLARVVARWQSHDRLVARLAVLGLYSVALISFAGFLILQTRTVWQATTGALGL